MEERKYIVSRIFCAGFCKCLAWMLIDRIMRQTVYPKETMIGNGRFIRVSFLPRNPVPLLLTAQYQLFQALPPLLEEDLPTVAEFAREFPLMSAVKLRIEIERALREFGAERGVAFDRPVSIMSMLRDLQRQGRMPANIEQMLGALARHEHSFAWC